VRPSRTLAAAALLVVCSGAPGCSSKLWAKITGKDAGASAKGDAGALAVAADGASPSLTVALADAASPSAVGGASSAAASRAATPPGPPKNLNVVLVTVDSLRWDMPWAGYPRPIAPALTALEAKSVDYTRSYAISSYTSMSLGGLLAGKLPGELSRDGFFFGTYHKKNVFFPELLQKAGVRTIGAHAHAYFGSAGFQQGFDKWELLPNIQFDNTTDKNITAPQHEKLAEKLLGDPALAAEDARFFAWFHFMDPHDQYMNHQPELPSWGRTRRDQYDGEITFTDKYLGKLFAFVASQPYGDRTAIIVSADHGEGLGEHNHYAHGFELWEMLVRVPLLVYIPGLPARREDTPRGAIDLAPTICELFGVAPDPGFEGVSLVPELYGKPAEPRDVILDLPTTSDSDRRRALLHGDLKIIAFGNDKYLHMYDLAKDPDELDKITKGPEFDEMKARYFAFEKTVKDIDPYGCLPNVCLNGAYKKGQDGGK
jgi:choline-sulfatase